MDATIDPARDSSVRRLEPDRSSRCAASPAVSADQLDFERFYAEASAPLTRMAVALTGSTSDAQELAQETLSRAYERWVDVAGLESPLGWCRRVLLNLVFSRTRRLRREAAALVRMRAQPVADLDPLAANEAASAFWAAVRTLSPRQAEVVVLHYGADLSTVEIAATLQRDPATVRSHLHAARRSLAAQLDLVNADAANLDHQEDV